MGKRLIISTDYPELLRFIFSGLRYEREFPIRDNFLLVRTLNHKDHMLLDKFQNYVIVSKAYATEEWGREEIFEYCKTELKSRRKPSFKLLTDDEFVRNMKIFWITGTWVNEDVEMGLFDLYKNIDCKVHRWREYFKLREQGMHPMQIMYSLLTFVGKAHNLTGDLTGLSKGYASVLSSKKRQIDQNFRYAIENYSVADKSLEEDIKVLRFLMDIGGGYNQ